MRCPHDERTVCACLEHKDPHNFACKNCPTYKKSVMEKEDPIDGYKTLGCLFVGICLLIIFGLTAYELVKRIPHEDTPVQSVVVH